MGIAIHLLISTFYFTIICVLLLGRATESPYFEVVLKETDFEIRAYKEISWMSSPVEGAISFQKATEDGFHRLYQYLHRGNLDATRLPITAPVLTTITQSPLDSTKYTVKLYLSPNYHGNNPPQPNPELNLQLEKWRIKCIAVRKFAGFAKDDNVNKEADALMASINERLAGNIVALVDKNSYSIAQYNASYHLIDRLNEVWMNMLNPSGQGCASG